MNVQKEKSTSQILQKPQRGPREAADRYENADPPHHQLPYIAMGSQNFLMKPFKTFIDLLEPLVDLLQPFIGLFKQPT